MASEESSSSAEPRRDRRRPRTPLDFALDRLGRRAHSEGELAHKMARAGYESVDIEKTLGFLRERRYVDDPLFARDFARARAERRRWGPARIAARLRALGLSDGDIDAAIAEAFPQGERDAAARALQRFLETDRSSGGERKKARAYRHLLSRGFSPETAHELVTERDFEDTEGLESRKSGRHES